MKFVSLVSSGIDSPVATYLLSKKAEELIFVHADNQPFTDEREIENFIKLARRGFYDGLTYHRIIPGFMVQGGDPLGTGTGNAGYTIDAEFNNRPFKRGTLGMARGGDPNSASCQFFICLTREKCKHLDNQYTAFGEVIKGMDIVNKIAKVKTGANDKPLEPVIMESVKIEMPEE